MLENLDPASADADLGPALSKAFPGFSFSTIAIDDFYWRSTDRTVLDADGIRLGNHAEWLQCELHALGGDLDAFWKRHRGAEHKS